MRRDRFAIRRRELAPFAKRGRRAGEHFRTQLQRLPEMRVGWPPIVHALLAVAVLAFAIAANAGTLSGSYNPPNGQIPANSSQGFYVSIGGAPAGAVITNVEARFDYTAFGVVQDYVSVRFHRGSDPGPFGGQVLVAQGALPEGNPGSTSYTSFSTWNGQSVDTDYWFHFSTEFGSPYDPTIHTIYVQVTYEIPPPPSAPSLSTPVDYGVRLNQTPHFFDWSSSPGATKYRIYVDNNSGFGSPEINQEPTSSQLSSGTSLQDNVYFWKVQAGDDLGQWGNWSPTRRFVVDTKPPAPSQDSPANGTQYTEGQSAPLFWSGPGSFSIDRYYLRIVQGTDLNASPQYDPPEANFTSDSVDLSGWPTGTYTWGVRAIKNHPTGFNQSVYESTIGWGPYATREFEVVPGPFDLSVSVGALPSNNAQQGNTVAITCTVTRTGSALPATGSYVRVYLYLGQSANSIEGGDPLIAGDPEQFDFPRADLDDGSESLQKIVTIPTGIEGPYYVHAVVDGPAFWGESDEGNNLGSSSTTMDIWRPGEPLPDEPDGVLARTFDDSTVFWIKYSKRWPILDQPTFFGLGYLDADVEWYGSGALGALTAGKTILTDNDDFVYRSQSVSTVYIVRNGVSDWFLNYAAFLASGFGDEDVYWTDSAGVTWIQGIYPLGSLVDTVPKIRLEPNQLDFQ